MLKRSRPDAFDQMSVLTTPATASKSRRIRDEDFIETMSPLTPGSTARSFHTVRTEHVDRDPFTPIKMREYEREQEREREKRNKEANEHLARDDGSVHTAATEAATNSTIIMSDNERSRGGKRLTRRQRRQRRTRRQRRQRQRRTSRRTK
jgi:hypothetical protein